MASSDHCTATKRDGEPCSGKPLPGKKLCRFHDPESREQAQAAAAEKRGSAGQDEAPDSLKLKTRPSMARDIAAAVEGLNDVLLALPWTREDALTQPEAERLVRGLDEGQKSNSRLRRYVKAGTEGSGLFALAIAMITIALPRLARHGLIPGMRRLSAEEYAEVQRQQQAAYEQLMRAQANGAGPVDPGQAPTVAPVYSNAG